MTSGLYSFTCVESHIKRTLIDGNEKNDYKFVELGHRFEPDEVLGGELVRPVLHVKRMVPFVHAVINAETEIRFRSNGHSEIT